MRGFGFGSGKARFLASAYGVTYSPEATAYFAAMSVQPNATRKGQLATLISSLVSGGVWSKLDWLSIHAAHAEQAARVNAINPAQVASVGVAPTFTVDRGHTGNGTTQYLNSGFNPSTAGGKYTQNSCCMAVWIGTNVNTGAQYDLGNSYASICALQSTSTLTVVPQNGTNGNFTTGITTSVGLAAWTRSASNAYAAYKNGALAGSNTTASLAIRNAPFTICAQNTSSTGTVTVAGFSTRRIQAAAWGQALSAGEQLALYNALSAYFTAIGA